LSFGPSGREVYPDSFEQSDKFDSKIILIAKTLREDLTGQHDNQSLTIYFVGDFLFLARFLLGFEGFYDNLLKFK
jgi:hypothetical protein